MSLGYNIKIQNEEPIIENFDRHHDTEITSYAPHTSDEYIKNDDMSKSYQIDITKETPKPLVGPMDSAWPMYCHDTHHTGRSPYSTADNPYDIKWMFDIYGPVWGGPVIDEDGIIYIGTDSLYALYPNGTLKWEYEERFRISSTPAIDENGILYIGAYWVGPEYIYAIYKNNGTLKWKYYVGDWIASSPAIGDDGSIYFGCFDNNIYALYPNGTLKWKYTTGDDVLSSPAIGDDGTIYCGSHDYNLYALYPDNGTVKWTFPTGYIVRVSPCIADDGTIYCVSRDGYLYALYHNNGTMIWKTNVHAGTSPTIGQDGTIYAGWEDLYAINPTNGSVKWTFDVGGKIEGGTPCNSVDGTIYLGNGDGSHFIAINPDGTEKWRRTIQGDVQSAPAIDEEGTVYIGNGMDDGHLFAFGYPGPNPLTPDIDGPTTGKPGTSYPYTFTSIDPDDDQVSYYIEWDDGDITDWTAFQPSGNPYSESHTWTAKGTYVVRAKVKDAEGHESDWGTLTVTMPRNRAYSNTLLLILLERFPLFREVLLRLITK